MKIKKNISTDYRCFKIKFKKKIMIRQHTTINIELLLKCDFLHIVKCDLRECDIHCTYYNEIKLCYDYSVIITALILTI